MSQDMGNIHYCVLWTGGRVCVWWKGGGCIVATGHCCIHYAYISARLCFESTLCLEFMHLPVVLNDNKQCLHVLHAIYNACTYIHAIYNACTYIHALCIYIQYYRDTGTFQRGTHCLKILSFFK